MNPAGYSGTPLAKKLGIAEGCLVVTRHAPANYEQLIEPVPPGVSFGSKFSKTTDLVHVFTSRKAVLEAELAALRTAIKPSAAVWVSWPKKAAKIATDITEDSIRDVCLPLGFVDVKVCADSATWSGLKLVIRKELR
jgi:hypothetical protein